MSNNKILLIIKLNGKKILGLVYGGEKKMEKKKRKEEEGNTNEKKKKKEIREK